MANGANVNKNKQRNLIIGVLFVVVMVAGIVITAVIIGFPLQNKKGGAENSSVMAAGFGSGDNRQETATKARETTTTTAVKQKKPKLAFAVLESDKQIAEQTLRKINQSFKKVKVIEIEREERASAVVKICDKEEFCERVVLTLKKEEGVWKIYEVRRITPMQSGEGYFYMATKKPLNVVKILFALLKDKKYSEAEDMFCKKQGSSSIRFEGLKQIREYLSFDEIKILGVDAREIIRGKALLPGEKRFCFGLEKQENGEWKSMHKISVTE